MNIVLINNLFFPYNRGGAEAVVKDMADKLRQNGHNVAVITSRPAFGCRKMNGEDAGKHRVYYLWLFNIVSYYNLHRLPKFLRFFWHLLDILNFHARWKIKKILNREKPDLVITHNLAGMGRLIPRLVKKLGIRHAHYLHDIQLLHPSGLMIFGREGITDSLPAKIYQSINRFLFMKTDEVASPSRWLLELHLARGYFKKSKKLIEHYDRPKNKMPGRAKGKDFIYLYAGQLEEHKGIRLLLEACGRLDREGARGYKLMILGQGGLENAVRRAAVSSGGKIVYAGQKTRAEVREMMANSDLLVVPSLCYENSPAVIREALACGLPVLGSDLGGIPELLGEQGVVFKPANIYDLTQKMKIALNGS